MILTLIAVGARSPSWVTMGFEYYRKRLATECKLNLLIIPLSKRTKKSNIAQLIAEEGRKIVAAIPKSSQVIALSERGKLWHTAHFAKILQCSQLERQNICFLIGGPDGLSLDCLNRATHIWSLSPLTFPHALVRILLVEQIYRAYSLLKGHPYHRE
jgi:23S rRNA (pseudouridine1915-N3)-methyltransferase